MLHQFLRPFHRWKPHARNDIFRCSCALGRFRDDSACLADRTYSGRMRAEDDRISAFQRDECFINRCGRRIRGGNDRCDHANRSRDLKDFLFSVFVDDSDRLHGTNSAVNLVSAEEILQCFVLDGPVTGLVDGHPGKRLVIRIRGFHRSDFTTDQYGHLAVEKVFLSHQNNVCGFHHSIGCFNRYDETARFYDAQYIVHNFSPGPGAYGNKNSKQKQLTWRHRIHMIFRSLKEDVACLHSEMTSFGSSFKSARETKGISIDQIPSEPRISTRFLLAIENEQFHLLPGGIFNRGFIRAYAEKVGLDPNQAVADYERLGGSGETSEDPGMETAGPAKRDRRLYPAAIAGLLLLIIILYLTTRASSNTAQLPSAHPPTPSATAPVVNSSTPPPGVEAPPVVPELQPAPSPPAEALRIDIEAKETSWIKVP